MLGFFLSLRKPGYRVFRTIFFAAVDDFGRGPGDDLLRALSPGWHAEHLFECGWIVFAHPGLAGESSRLRLGALIAIDIWSGIGFYSVLFFAALSSVPGRVI